ncbi:10 TM acyl transferase domain found in Cas1p-domain-containing protein [Phycomyces blakesleeanus]|uniref:10 TM acyl transferase domain found in Cas1p-domain-containing protein n=2 Tax=Phycomyces blakesleeanus TaxID=4837 RepID=A0ABR3B0S3_PHYBL
MFNKGWWTDDTFQKWQPAGCMSHEYTPKEISTCLNHSRVLYIGDSIMREQYYSMAKLSRDFKITGSLHIDRHMVFEELGMVYDFWWDPYLNSTRTIELLEGKSKEQKPSLLVMGSGTWHMRRLKKNYFKVWKPTMERVFKAVEKHRIADTVLLSPVETPKYDLLWPPRFKTITAPKISQMNAYLKKREAELKTKVPFKITYVWNEIASTSNNATIDGLHFLQPVTKAQGLLALNFRCNQELPKTFPMDTTCCYTYPSPQWFQTVWFLVPLVWVPFCFLVANYEKRQDQFFVKYLVPSNNVLYALLTMGLGVGYMYLGDRTQLFGKIHKVFQPVVFSGLLLLLLGVGLVTLRKKESGDQGFLNRAQTDEWKGWMQIIILVYHFLGASSVSGIYNPVRVLVAAYLFQTGYGHFFFFYKKGDYSFGRVLSIMVRLNLLTFVLQYLMNTNYLSYYFSPLVSFWFIIIWVTMYVGNKWNKTPSFLLAKMFGMAMLTTLIIHYPGLLEFAFKCLEYTFNIQWNPVEWRFRLALDAWIVYVGMLIAYLNIKITEQKLPSKAYWSTAKNASIVVSCVAMIWYFWFELSRPNKFVYNTYHPYISWIPVLAFTILRNCTLGLRNRSSRFFEFIGKCSLETFIGQFHMWLAADTQGLLLILANPMWAHGLGWWVNLGLSTVLFVFVSYHLSQATGEITQWICSGANKKNKNNTSGHIPVELSTARDTTTSGSNADVEYQSVPLLAETKQDELSLSPSLSSASPQSNSSSDRFLGNEGSRSNNVVVSMDDQLYSDKQYSNDDSAEESWTYESNRTSTMSRMMSKIGQFIGDTRFKTLIFLICVGIANNFC